MLIEFFGRNFLSFRDEFCLSMLASDIDPGNDRGIVFVPLDGEDEPLRLLRCAAIYGPNASGKSTLLLAAHALGYLLRNSGHLSSDEPLEPYEPFLLDDDSFKRPVHLGLRAVINRRVYEYQIEFLQTEFVREELVEIAPDAPRKLFLRKGQDVVGEWTSERQFELLTDSFRPNALLLSLADRLAPGMAEGIAVGFARALSYHDPTRHYSHSRFGPAQAARRAVEDQGFGHWLLDWVRDADIGIVDFEAQRLPGEASDEETDRTSARRRPEHSLNLVHAGSHGPIRLDFHHESLGTRKMVELAPFMHELLHGDAGYAFFIDEIGASMHPSLLAAILRRFNCDAKPESVRGQLIFATQETILLDAEAKDATLRRDQVYLTEKDSLGASRLYSIAEFKERNNLNLRRRYLQGRYGALPAVGRLGD